MTSGIGFLPAQEWSGVDLFENWRLGCCFYLFMQAHLENVGFQRFYTVASELSGWVKL